MTSSDVGASPLLSGFSNPTTLFAPTNAALNALPTSVVNRLTSPAYKGLLDAVLLYHTLPQSLRSTDLVDHATVMGKTVFVPPGFLTAKAYIDQGAVVAANVPAANGIVHKVDQLLLPSGAMLPLNVVEQAQSVAALSTLGTSISLFKC